jgi:hypothetical protein
MAFHERDGTVESIWSMFGVDSNDRSSLTSCSSRTQCPDETIAGCVWVWISFRRWLRSADRGAGGRAYLANSTARVSRTTVTLI